MSFTGERAGEIRRGTGIRTEPYTLGEIDDAIADLKANPWKEGKHSMTIGDWETLRNGILSEQAEARMQEALGASIADLVGEGRAEPDTGAALDRIEGAVLDGIQEITDASNQMATDPESARIIGDALAGAFSDAALNGTDEEPRLLPYEPFSDA